MIHRALDDVAVLAVKRLVHVQDRLHVVFAGGQRVEVGDGVANGAGVERRDPIGRDAVDVDAEDLLGGDVLRYLQPGFATRVLRQHDQQTSVGRCRVPRFGHRHPERQRLTGTLAAGHPGGENTRREEPADQIERRPCCATSTSSS